MTANLANAAMNGNLNPNRNLYPRSICAGLSMLALAICAGVVSVPSAAAQVEAATTVAAPVVMPQYSTLTSTNDTIQVSRLPITYNGTAYYVDVTLALTAEASSTAVTSVAVATTWKTSPSLTVNNFKAGTYVGPSNIWGGKMEIVVSGPSPVPGGTAWTLSTPSGASPYTYPDTAVWYAEPIADSPLAARLSAAKITSPDYSYGVGDAGSEWCDNSLLGFQQVGNSLSISSFSGCGDQETPWQSVTYTLVQ